MNESELLDIASEIFETSIEDQNLDSPIKDLKNWDSIKNLMLLNYIEESKNFHFTDGQLDSIVSLRDVLKIIKGVNE